MKSLAIGIALILITAAGCNSGVVVSKRHKTRDGAYVLTIRGETGGTIAALVSERAYKYCSIGERYPECAN